MSDQKPKLKLKLGGPKKGQEAQDQGIPATPQSATPATPKITLKFGSASAAAPSTPKAVPPPPAPSPKPSKSGRKPKPTAKKRTLDTALADDNIDDDESDSEPLASKKPSTSQPPIKKIKITAGGAGKAKKAATVAAAARTSSGPTNIRIKKKGKVPERPLGVGYDSEASDREDDPTIHEDIILRMPPGEDSDYLRQSIANNTIGTSQDVTMRFVTSNGRRACLTIRGRRYAAVLVDLPCVIEAMKSWNKKEFYKSADVCQMLLVLGRVATDEEAIGFEISRAAAAGLVGRGELDEKTWAWAHGLTPPMRWVRKRRFRKRISTRLVEEDEREVERLLKDDADAKGGFTYRHVDLDALEREQAEADAREEYEDYEDADGEVDEGYDANNSEVVGAGADIDDDDDLEAHLEAEMLKQAHESAVGTENTLLAGDAMTESPAPTTGLADAASPPLTASATATPSFETPATAGTATTTKPKPKPPTATAAGTPSASNDAGSTPITSSPASDSGSEESNSASPSGSSDHDNDNAPADADDDEDEREEAQDRQRQREEIADLEAAIVREEQRLKVTPNAILKQKIARTIQGLRADLDLLVGGGDDGGEEGGGKDGGGVGGGGGG